MKEIGGYIEFEQYNNPMMHEGAVALNCGRNCLAYLIKSKQIKSIILPYFLCDSVSNICKEYGTKIRYYHIKENFLPENITLADNEWMYLVNYYGQITSDEILEFSQKYKNIVIDQAQAYFQQPVQGIDTLYTCRKFFGVSDGAFLYTDKVLEEKFTIDESFERMHFLLGRYEQTADKYYHEYVENNRMFASEPIKYMSKLTDNLLHGIDYEAIKTRRTENYRFLSKKLDVINRLNLLEVEGAFAYPLLLNNAVVVRKKFIENKIYIPLLWPNVIENVSEDSLEYDYANNILPLPCDQRYDIDDMKRICSVLLECLKQEHLL